MLDEDVGTFLWVVVFPYIYTSYLILSQEHFVLQYVIKVDFPGSGIFIELYIFKVLEVLFSMERVKKP